MTASANFSYPCGDGGGAGGAVTAVASTKATVAFTGAGGIRGSSDAAVAALPCGDVAVHEPRVTVKVTLKDASVDGAAAEGDVLVVAAAYVDASGAWYWMGTMSVGGGVKVFNTKSNTVGKASETANVATDDFKLSLQGRVGPSSNKGLMDQENAPIILIRGG